MRYLPLLGVLVVLVVLMASWGRTSPIQVSERILLGIAIIFVVTIVFGLVIKAAL